MAPRYEFTFSKSFRVDKGVKDAFEDEGFIVVRSLWSGAEVQRLLRFFETSPTIERNSYREIDGRGRTSGPSTLFIYYTFLRVRTEQKIENSHCDIEARTPMKESTQGWAKK